MKLLVKKLDKRAKLPTYGTPFSVGLDLYSTERLVIYPFEIYTLGTGIAVEIKGGGFGPFETACLEIRPRSGLAAKHGFQILNTPGTIDPDYRGELMVICSTFKKFEIFRGERIAQLLLTRHHYGIDIVEVEELSSTERGTRGLGSTGR